METKTKRTPRLPKVWEALMTLMVLIAIMAVGIIVFEADPHIPMFIGVVTAAIMALYLGYDWETIENSMKDGIYRALQSIMILAIIGILIGVWLVAGVVPTMIFYGLKNIITKHIPNCSGPNMFNYVVSDRNFVGNYGNHGTCAYRYCSRYRNTCTGSSGSCNIRGIFWR